MKFKRIMLLGIVVIFMAGTLSKEAATAQNSTALEPWTIGVIDQVDKVYLGEYVSIDHYKYNGSAYISYYDQLHGDLKLAYEVSPGTGNCFNKNWECETADASTNVVGRYSSIDVFEATLIKSSGLIFHYAKIGISYYDFNAQSLKYAQKSCSEGILGLISCTWSITTVDNDLVMNPDNIGQYTSFQFNDVGTPVIFYHGQSGSFDNVGYVKRATTPPTGSVTGECGNGWDCEVVARSDAGRTFGTHISADGNTVAFFDGPKYKLVLARRIPQLSNTCGMSNNWDCIVVDTDAGRFVSLVDDGVHPTRMVYYDAYNGTINHAIASSSGTGNCGDGYFSCNAIDTIGVDLGEPIIGISLTLDNEGEPIIAYQDFSDAQGPPALKIARPYYVYDKPSGNCGDVFIGFIKFWQCDYLGGGGSWLYPANYVSVSVSPAGLATIAYYELDDYYKLGRLKVAQEHKVDLAVYLPLIIK